MKLNACPNFWTNYEGGLIARHYPKIDFLLSILEFRSRTVIKRRARRLGLRDPKIRSWTCGEVITLRKYYKIMPVKEFMKLMPERSYDSIRSKARCLQIKRHKLPRLIPTGVNLIDTIKIEASHQNMTTVDLDYLSNTGEYFSRKCRHRPVDFYACAQAIQLFGGRLEIVWNERRIQIL